jgi:hypothetical protein
MTIGVFCVTVLMVRSSYGGPSIVPRWLHQRK